MKQLFREIPSLYGEHLTIQPLTQEHTEGLRALVQSPIVYRYLPTFLFEKKYDDVDDVIRHLYDECLEDSLILGLFRQGDFCGLAELYGYRGAIHKISIGYRLLEKYWGQGIAGEAVNLLLAYVQKEKGIEIITASSMVENHASARVLEKSGFVCVGTAWEDWGFDRPTRVHKWIH